MPSPACFTECKEQPCIFFCLFLKIKKMMGSFTKTECFQEQNCLFFKSLEGFYSLQPAPLDTLEKPDLQVFTKMKSFCFLKYSSARENSNENGKELFQITPSG